MKPVYQAGLEKGMEHAAAAAAERAMGPSTPNANGKHKQLWCCLHYPWHHVGATWHHVSATLHSVGTTQHRVSDAQPKYDKPACCISTTVSKAQCQCGTHMCDTTQNSTGSTQYRVGTTRYHCGMSAYHHVGTPQNNCYSTEYDMGMSLCCDSMQYHAGKVQCHCGIFACYCGIFVSHCGIITCHYVTRPWSHYATTLTQCGINLCRSSVPQTGHCDSSCGTTQCQRGTHGCHWATAFDGCKVKCLCYLVNVIKACHRSLIKTFRPPTPDVKNKTCYIPYCRKIRSRSKYSISPQRKFYGSDAKKIKLFLVS